MLRLNRSHYAALWLSVMALVSGASSTTAHAHIKLLQPEPWIVTDATGNPQKSGPCGTTEPGSAATNVVTTFKAGEEITVEWMETVDHPGHFRIALASNRAELVDPDLKPAAGTCDYPAGSVPTEPHGNVLLDNVFPTTTAGGAHMYSQQVKLPNEPCDHCTLQLIQWMTKHPPSCLYYQCADIKIVAADQAQAGSGAAGSSHVAAGSGGGHVDDGDHDKASSAASKQDSGGCTVQRPGRSASALTWVSGLVGLASWVRRVQRRRTRAERKAHAGAI